MLWSVRIFPLIPCTFTHELNGQLRAKFERFDLDNSGCIDAEELEQAFDRLEKLAQANELGSVPFSSFPDDVEEELKAFDSDGQCLL